MNKHSKKDGIEKSRINKQIKIQIDHSVTKKRR